MHRAPEPRTLCRCLLYLLRWPSRCRRQTRSGRPCQAPPSGDRCEAPREAARARAGCEEPVRSLRRAPAFLSRFAPDDPDLLRNRPVPDRLLVVSAGVTANLAFAFLVVYVQALTIGVPVQAQLPGVLVPEVRPGSSMDVVQVAERALTEARPTSPARSRGGGLAMDAEDTEAGKRVMRM